MSLNTLESNKSPTFKPKSDPRSLKTDDIEGARPKNFPRRIQNEPQYTGLLIPSYTNPSNPSTKPALSSLPLSPKPVYSSSPVPKLTAKAAAQFFGSTPPPSRAGVSSKALPQAQIPKYSPIPSQGPGFIPASSSEKNLANYFRTDKNLNKGTGLGKYTGGGREVAVPDKALRDFYGSTPPRKGFGDKEGLGMAGKKVVDGKKSSTGERIFGAGTLEIGRDLENQAKGPVGYNGTKSPTYALSPKGSYGQIEVSRVPGSKFFGSTPPPGGSLDGTYKPMAGKNDLNYLDSQGARVSPKGNGYEVIPAGKPKKPSMPYNPISNIYSTNVPTNNKNPDPQEFVNNAGKFFGADSVSPEFQYASNIAGKQSFNPYGRHKAANENTAARIFN